jgi:hypothetical protein
MDVIYTRRSQYDPTVLFLIGIVGYVVLLCAVALAQSGALKAMANAFAVLLFLVLASTAVSLREESRQLTGFTGALFIYYTAIVASVIVTPTYVSVATLLKLTMAPAFFLVGGAYETNRSAWTWENGEARLLFWSLAILPLLVLAWQIIIGDVGFGAQPALSESEDGAAFGIFANRNNAALYAVSLLALYNVLSGRPVKNVLFILVLCAAFGTLGVLVAAVAALTVAVGGRGAVKALILAGFAVVLAYFLMPEAPGLKRLTPVLQSLLLLYDGSIDLRTVGFGQLVEMLGTTDLSFLFRLKHWLNLWDLYAGASGYEWLFGVGIGSSVPLSSIGLVPHNDYMRLLFECGILGFAGFVAMIATIVYQCGRRWESVPLFIISFYFISENLVNNYLAMAIFYFCAGSLATRVAEVRHD